MNPYVTALAKPAIICLCLGIVQFGQDYQANGKLVPALVDGLVSAAKAGITWSSYNGLVLSVQNARARLAAARASSGSPKP